MTISPLSYAGGKTRACSQLEEILHNFDCSKIKRVVSPFFGGGSFEFYLNNLYGWPVVANDLCEPLANFWSVLKEDRHALASAVRAFPHPTREDFLAHQKEVVQPSPDRMRRAVLYFIISRCSYSALHLSGGFSQFRADNRFTPNSITSLENTPLPDFTFSNQDCLEFMEEQGGQDDSTLLFLDPPYHIGANSKLYGKSGDLHKDFNHEALCEALKGRRNWMLTYNDDAYIRQLYSDCTILEVSWKYGMSNRTSASSEIVIIKTTA